MKAARLVVLTVALAAGGVAAMLAGRSNKPPEVKQAVAAKPATVDVLVAKSDLPMGKAITPGDVTWQAWPATTTGGNFIRKPDRPNAIESLAGSIARVPFVAGEPIRQAKLVDAKGSGFMAAILPTGMRAVSTQISPETGAGGFILPNDHVDVILTRRDKNAEKATGTEVQVSETILANVRVLAIDQNVEEKNGQKVVVGKTATLELSQRQAETLALSHQLGTLSLALRSITDSQSDKPKIEDEPDSRRNGVNVVRFGVSTVTTPK
ncbi:MAG TPA: Flp pilus assembly protein CpaB [Pseudolabrys sp.]|jgi:pilus assembly protein CpaB|nr:Flp pilus assembly protein CpaB [Pseudolabrys sp.]